MKWRRVKEWIIGWCPKESLDHQRRITVIWNFLERTRSLLIRFKYIVPVFTSILIIILYVLSIPMVYNSTLGRLSPTFQETLPSPSPLESPPSQWIHIAHFEDNVGDQVAPFIDPNGSAIGGLSYKGADILNVSVYSPLFSKKLILTIYLNGNGRGDPTIDKNRTRVHVEFKGKRLWSRLNGFMILYYDGNGFGRCRHIDGIIKDYDVIYVPSERLQWIGDNVVKVIYEGLPRWAKIDRIEVNTEIWYREESETEDKPHILHVLDNLAIKDYVTSLGRPITQLDLSKQLSPASGSTMSGMDIQTVDIYRGGEYLNITVILSDPGFTDKSIPPTFDHRQCLVEVRMKENIWACQYSKQCVSSGWIDPGKRYSIVFNISDLGGIRNPDIIHVIARAGSFSIVDGKIADGGFGMWWFFDVCSFNLYPEEG